MVVMMINGFATRPEYTNLFPGRKIMNTVIRDRTKDPLGAMMLDYLRGDADTAVEVESTTLEMPEMRGEVMFRDYSRMDGLEQRALALCEGRILDVGAGSGCHSLWLQQRHDEVEAVDISPGCVQVMRRRLVRNVRHRNLFGLKGRRYNTILMLMNGLGVCGSVEGLHLLLRHLKRLLARGGQVIADSTDLTSLFAGAGGFSTSRYFGETEFVMRYKEIVSDPFPWLYIDFPQLRMMAEENGLRCEQLMTAAGGRYLLRILSMS